MFTSVSPFPGIYHITDAMGVSFTLIEGGESSLLFDTGYGMENVSVFVSTLTKKPLKVFLSHGHHDHMLGSRWFGKTWLCGEDMDEFRFRSGKLQRTKVKAQADAKHVDVPADFMDVPIALPDRIIFPDFTGEFESRTENLGLLDTVIIHVPGHTPGSIVIYIPAYSLLLTGDDWNPCTWMWFPSSLGADQWRNHMLSLINSIEKAYKKEISSVLCSHQPMLRAGAEMKNFLAYMNETRMKEAGFTDMGAPINTHIIRNEEKDWTLVFDADKRSL